MRHWSPQLKPSGYSSWRGLSSEKGMFCRLRGMPKRTVSPVSVSTLATMIESGRIPSRSVSASEPTSMMLTRPVSDHGSGPSPGAAAPSGRRVSKTDPMRECWITA